MQSRRHDRGPVRHRRLLGRYVVVVDDDVDVYDMNDVMWAMCTRVDPVKDMDLFAGLGAAR